MKHFEFMFPKYKQCKAKQTSVSSTCSKSSLRLKTKKAVQKLHWSDDSSTHVHSAPTLGPHGAIKPPKQLHPTPSRPTPPLRCMTSQCACATRKKKKTLNLLPLNEWFRWKWIKQQRRHLHSRASHGPPTEKKRSVQWFQSEKTIVSNLGEGGRERKREREIKRGRESEGKRERVS